MIKKMLLLFLCLAGWLPVTGAAETRLMPVLCLASEDVASQGLTCIEPKALEMYRKAGFDLHFDYYQKITPELLNEYPLVVGMIPQLHAGTRAIGEKQAKYLDDYLQQGGGVILIPGPSYYTADDFPKQLNPFLQRYGNELLNETPRDPNAENNHTLTRALAYRYLKTSNLNRQHKVTQNIPFIYLPLDFSDSYLRTYTMKPDSTWTILVSGEKSTMTTPWKKAGKFRENPGTYTSSPPFLAVRDVGKGRLAVFTTASRYFIYDAGHWSFGEGFVLNEGNGLALMGNLFHHVGKKEYSPVKVVPEPQPEVTGNLPVFQEKRNWVKAVLHDYAPSGFGVRQYIDCGALSDAPYSAKRGAGVKSDEYQSWIIRQPAMNVFHPTASTLRACSTKSFSYRFDHLAPGGDYKLGILLWSTQDEGARNLILKFSDGKEHKFALPRYKQHQGPRFEVIDIPAAAIGSGGELEVTFSRGEGGTGDFTTLAELWLFERNAPKMSPETLLAEYDSLIYGVADSKLPRKIFKGLIGARSTHTDGNATVSELAAAARESGLDFLIFTDPLEQLTGAKLAMLRKECAAASQDGFMAIPGLELTTPDKGKKNDVFAPLSAPIKAGFYGEITDLPTMEMLNEPYSLFWKFFGGELASGRKTVGNLIAPAENCHAPFFQRFWRGFALNNSAGKQADSDQALALYNELTAAGYGPYAQSRGIYRDAEAIRQAANANFTGLSGGINGHPLDALYSGIASSGPVIDSVSFASDAARDGEIGNGDIFRTAIRTLAKLEAHYPAGIAKVTLFKSGRPVRVFYPKSPKVKIVEPVLITGQTELYFMVEGTDGARAVTTAYNFIDDTMRSAMCADNQNSICSVTRPPGAFVLDERELFLQHSYWHTGEAIGQLGVMRDARNLVPRVIETGIIQLCKYFQPVPRLTFAKGSQENHLRSKMKIAAAGAEGNIITYETVAPEAFLHNFTAITSFRPAVDGNTVSLVEMDITVNKAIKSQELRNFTLLQVGLMPNFPAQWQYAVETAPGVLAQGMLSGQSSVLNFGLVPHGIAALYPNNLANLVVISLSDMPFEVALDNIKAWNCRERLTILLPKRDFRAGEKLRVAFLVMLAQETITGSADITRLKQTLVNREPVVAAIRHGKLAGANYAISGEAENHAFAFESTNYDYRDPLPIRVSGLNDNWSSGIYAGGEYTPGASRDSVLLGTVNSNQVKGVIAVGNPVISDTGDAMIELDGVTGHGVRLRVHNPDRELRKIALSRNPAFADALPDFDVSVTLPPGGSMYLTAAGKKITIDSVR